MSKSLPKSMRNPRSAKPMNDYTSDAWWYIDTDGISVHADCAGAVSSVRLTRKQLERAIEVMEALADADQMHDAMNTEGGMDHE